VINDKGYDGATADLWSCGVILFVLMAGYLPFDDSNLMTLYKKICKADFTCPPWFSSSVKKLISRILDPNPKTRITASKILENEWFKKDYKPPEFQEDEDVNLDDVDAVFNDSEEHLVTEKKETQPVLMNAFELISKSQGLNLGNLFEKHMGLVKRETRFTSKHPAKEIISRIEEAAGPLGFNVTKMKYKMKLQGAETGRKGRLFIMTEVLEVAQSFSMVEVRKAGGDTLEFHKRAPPTNELSYMHEVITRSQRELQQTIRESQREMCDALTDSIMDSVKVLQGHNILGNHGATNNGEESSSKPVKTSIKPPPQIFRAKFLQKEEQPIELDPPSDVDDIETWGEEYAALSFRVKAMLSFSDFCQLKNSKGTGHNA
ncbi:hypothetical protein KI387_040861, partial [Taxus chinensis]